LAGFADLLAELHRDVTQAEYRARYAQIEAHARMLAGHEIMRRAANGGRYWALGAQIAEWQAGPVIEAIEADMIRQIHILNQEWNNQAEEELRHMEARC
jgi:hypothetical protein